MKKEPIIHTCKGQGYDCITHPETGVKDNVILFTHVRLDTKNHTTKVWFCVHTSRSDFNHLRERFDAYYEAVDYYNAIVKRYMPKERKDIEQYIMPEPDNTSANTAPARIDFEDCGY